MVLRERRVVLVPARLLERRRELLVVGVRDPLEEQQREAILPRLANGLRGIGRGGVSEEPFDDVWLLLATV